MLDRIGLQTELSNALAASGILSDDVTVLAAAGGDPTGVIIIHRCGKRRELPYEVALEALREAKSVDELERLLCEAQGDDQADSV